MESREGCFWPIEKSDIMHRKVTVLINLHICINAIGSPCIEQ